MEKQLYTLPEVQEALSLGRSKIYELIGTGDLKPLRVGRAVRFRAQEIEEFVERLQAEQAGGATS
jgi:excisionase family DNA binding protein